MSRRRAEPAAVEPGAEVEPVQPMEASLVRRSRGRRAVGLLPPSRPEGVGGPVPSVAAAPTASLFGSTGAAEPSTSWFSTFFGQAPAQPRGTLLPAVAGRGQIDALIAHHAKLNGVPESLVHRIVVRESRYNPRAVGRGGAMGLMQIKTGTARALGYGGGPAGLLDAETNLTYAVKYLAGAYRTAGGDHDRAVSHYARGYYYEAKRRGTLETASADGEPRTRRRGRRRQEASAAAAEPVVAEPVVAEPALPAALVLRTEDRAAR